MSGRPNPPESLGNDKNCSFKRDFLWNHTKFRNTVHIFLKREGDRKQVGLGIGKMHFQHTALTKLSQGLPDLQVIFNLPEKGF